MLLIRVASTEKINIGNLEVTITEKSNLPPSLKRVLVQTLKPVLIRIIGSDGDYQYFNRLHILLTDNFDNKGSIREWYYRAYFNKKGYLSELDSYYNSLVLAAAETDKAVLSGEYSFYINLDLLLYQITRILVERRMIPSEWNNHDLGQVSITSSNPDLVAILPDEALFKALSYLEGMVNQQGVSVFIEEKMKVTVRHELTHLFHVMKSKSFFLSKSINIDRMDNMRKRISNSANKSGGAIYQSLIDNFILYRMYLENFSRALLMEGLARYASEPLKKKREEWDELYAKAAGAVSDIEEELKILYSTMSFFERENLKMNVSEDTIRSLNASFSCLSKRLFSDMYDLGLHMVYTTSFYHFSVFELDHKQFCRLYEQICQEKFGKQPLVSYDSGKGAIDITKLRIWILDKYRTVKAAKIKH